MSSLDAARAALTRYFGYPVFRSGQEEAVGAVLAGKDTLVVLPTGGGKSLCYQVPALVLPRPTIVISPLISLMKDQVDALVRRGVPATFVNSTLSSSQISSRIAETIRGDIKLLYVAPERFDFGKTAERLAESGISLLAVDEAHCISEWGHDFRPSYLRIAEVRKRLGWPPTVALTATATPHVRKDIATMLKLEAPKIIITGFDRTNLSYTVVPARTEQVKDTTLLKLLRKRDGLAVVYAPTRKGVERLADLLSRSKVRAAAYHAGLDDAQRETVQDAFMNEKVRAIVATNAFGMGVDKANVRLVVHYSMPGNLEAYYQEAGRAGRDGMPSECFLLHAYPDRFTHEYFIKGAHPERRLVEDVYDAMRRAAARDGSVPLAPDRIVSRLKSKATARDVESALRVLTKAGAYVVEPENGGRVLVRLLATPERITRELGSSSESLELGLLRALWRTARRRLEDGVAVDLDGLPPGFGGAMGALPVLERLQGRQLVQYARVGSGARLTYPGRDLSRFEIDWAVMERRRAADLAKLDMMQRYAYCKTCRRAFVLRYFGDRAARPSCDGCDNCTVPHGRRATRP